MIAQRGNMSGDEREARSQLAKAVHRKPFVQGSIVKTLSKCGKDNCWCAESDKGHPACYLAIRVGSRRKMMYVSANQEKEVREWVKNYREIMKSIAKVSRYWLDRFERRKRSSDGY